ncbi:MAG: mannose-1-phosphate guanylyltransferase/mannose-6-phosphate isomerase, partial [Acidobacteriota bacterium]
MIIPVILAGGSGTRLWPLSRELNPKQLLPLVNDLSMIQNTAQRLSGMEGVADPIVICNENHRFLVAEQFRALNIKPASIILEPCGRNTAPAVAIAALSGLSASDDPILLILPADHHIGDVEGFRKAVRAGAELSRQKFLVTFGIEPNAPETGYGYIEKGEPVEGACRIARFVEKPDLGTAKEYLQSGRYLWNSGMFMFQASRILDEMENLAPAMIEACRKAYSEGTSDLDFYRLDRPAFEACPSDSIDYAVMEKTRSGVMVPLSVGWNDLGSWDALWQIKDKDQDQNVTVGDVLIHDVEGSYVHATSRLVAAIGLKDHVVVETPDAVMISPRDRVQDIKVLVQRLKTSNREEALVHNRVFRPWGCYECINIDDRFQ